MVMNIGAICFGIVVGYITYRTLIRKNESSISDIAAVIAALGGGAITGLFDPSSGEAFGWYAIGLLVGMTIFLLLRLRFERPRSDGTPAPTVLGDAATGDRPPDTPTVLG